MQDAAAGAGPQRAGGCTPGCGASACRALRCLCLLPCPRPPPRLPPPPTAQIRSWSGSAWCSCTRRTSRLGRPWTPATCEAQQGGRRPRLPCVLPRLAAAISLHVRHSCTPLIHLPAACLALPASSGTPAAAGAGSWARIWSARAATACSTRSACTTPPSAARSCPAASGPAHAVGRSRRWAWRGAGWGVVAAARGAASSEAVGSGPDLTSAAMAAAASQAGKVREEGEGGEVDGEIERMGLTPDWIVVSWPAGRLGRGWADGDPPKGVSRSSALQIL